MGRMKRLLQRGAPGFFFAAVMDFVEDDERASREVRNGRGVDATCW